MAKNELIKYAGYSVSADGKMRFRTATTEHRINQLCDLGEDVNMISITPVATKSEAAKELIRGVFAKVFPEIPMTPKQAEKIREEFNAKNKDLV